LNIGDIVEAVTDRVGGQESLNVYCDIQQVFDRMSVLGPIQSNQMQRQLNTKATNISSIFDAREMTKTQVSPRDKRTSNPCTAPELC